MTATKKPNLERLANDMVSFLEDFDPYEFRDGYGIDVEGHEAAYNDAMNTILTRNGHFREGTIRLTISKTFGIKSGNRIKGTTMCLNRIPDLVGNLFFNSLINLILNASAGVTGRSIDYPASGEITIRRLKTCIAIPSIVFFNVNRSAFIENACGNVTITFGDSGSCSL